MSKYAYPAIITKEESGLYFVEFPDFEACFTQGTDIPDALYMAQDVLALTLCDLEDSNKLIPIPSEPQEIEVGEDSFVNLVCADTFEYRKEYGGQLVRKNCTIPAWLNTMSERQGINFSAVLQSALKEQLNISNL